MSWDSNYAKVACAIGIPVIREQIEARICGIRPGLVNPYITTFRRTKYKATNLKVYNNRGHHLGSVPCDCYRCETPVIIYSSRCSKFSSCESSRNALHAPHSNHFLCCRTRGPSTNPNKARSKKRRSCSPQSVNENGHINSNQSKFKKNKATQAPGTIEMDGSSNNSKQN